MSSSMLKGLAAGIAIGAVAVGAAVVTRTSKANAARVAMEQAAAAPVAQVAMVPQSNDTIEVWKSATCGCCHMWIEYLQQQGFVVVAHDMSDPDLSAIKAKNGITDKLALLPHRPRGRLRAGRPRARRGHPEAARGAPEDPRPRRARHDRGHARHGRHTGEVRGGRVRRERRDHGLLAALAAGGRRDPAVHARRRRCAAAADPRAHVRAPAAHGARQVRAGGGARGRGRALLHGGARARRWDSRRPRR